MMKTTTVYFTRHGEVHNPQKILYGRLPRFPLSENGKKEAQFTAEELKDKGINVIYCSPMLRARQTAGIIGKVLGIKPKIIKDLTELRLLFQGMPSLEYKAKVQPFLFEEKYVRKGQEGIEEVYQRMKKTVARILKNHQGEKVLIVSHGDPILIYVAKTSGAEFTWEYKKNNYLKTGRYSTLTYQQGKHIWK
jgi:probable phosphoglycerate mutase